MRAHAASAACPRGELSNHPARGACRDAGNGSPFAKQAARELARRQSLDSAFRRIAVAVNKATGGQQSPWRQGDLPFDVYLAGMAEFPVP